MRADICHYYPKPVEDVYQAYKTAIKNLFKNDAGGDPYCSLVFGLSFSFKYNMNGGGCHIHFMPYLDGTAINVRYTIAQAVGAKYKAHDKDMCTAVSKLLGVEAKDVQINVEEFLQYEKEAPHYVEDTAKEDIPALEEYSVETDACEVFAPEVVEEEAEPASIAYTEAPDGIYAEPAPAVAPVAPVPPQANRNYARFCTQCGTQFTDFAMFCTKCGAKRKEL